MDVQRRPGRSCYEPSRCGQAQLVRVPRTVFHYMLTPLLLSDGNLLKVQLPLPLRGNSWGT